MSSLDARRAHIARGRRSIAGPETQAMRPNAGMSQDEREETNDLVKQLMRAALDRLPDGAKLSDEAREEAYATAARVLSERFGRAVSVEQVRLVAACMRNRGAQPTKPGVGLLHRHHALLQAEHAATGETMSAINARALDRYFELSPEG